MPEEIKNIQLRSEEVQEILSFVPHWMIRWGNTLFFLLIIMLLFITWFIKYPDVITTEVMRTTVNLPEKLFANLTGRFDPILVNDREKVSTNQTLAVLENSSIYQDVLLLKNVIDIL
ncbi:MAG: hypothetical protein ABJH82_12545 [Polaribacter sp.]|uniref:hypothetical protein n=1 Tax=Polaribacter sp. TaxID=1920175 RepID=UPI0032679235